MAQREVILDLLSKGDVWDKMVYEKISEDSELDLYYSLQYVRRAIVDGYSIPHIGSIVNGGRSVVVRGYKFYDQDKDLYIVYLFTVDLL